MRCFQPFAVKQVSARIVWRAGQSQPGRFFWKSSSANFVKSEYDSWFRVETKKHMRIHAPAFAPGLPAQYRLLREQETLGVLQYTVECIEVPRACPVCGAPVKPWGSKERVILDIPRGRKRVEFHIAVKRFWCSSSKREDMPSEGAQVAHSKTLLQELPAISPHRSMTQRLVDWIGEECRRRTFMEVARQIGVADATVRSVFAEHVKRLERAARFSPPESLALVQPRIMHKECTAFLNVQAQTLVDIVPGVSSELVAAKLQQLAANGPVRRVSISTVQAFRDAVQQALPAALLFVDKPYVLALADESLNRARQACLKEQPGRLRKCSRALIMERPESVDVQRQAELRACLDAAPVLADAHRARQALQDLYDKPPSDRQEAALALEKALSCLGEKARAFFAEFDAVLIEWRSEILAYFDIDAQGARVEVLGDLKHLGNWAEGQGRGHAFEAVRAALLFPARVPAFSYRTPGLGLASLKQQAQKQRGLHRDDGM